jgi:hypothetical protein
METQHDKAYMAKPLHTHVHMMTKAYFTSKMVGRLQPILGHFKPSPDDSVRRRHCCFHNDWAKLLR